MDESVRSEVLASFGAGSPEIAELLAYNTNDFRHDQAPRPIRLPLPPEAHLAAWEGYEHEARLHGAFNVLREVLVQLSFPVLAGLSQSEAYRAATLQGVGTGELKEASGLVLSEPGGIELQIHDGLGGRIPVIIARRRSDFCLLVQALTCRNEPHEVPDSMGACIVAGYNNWDRIRAYRREWEHAHPELDRIFGWQQEFRRLLPFKELYQDRFIVLSDNPYSGLKAGVLGLAEEEWRRLSLTIRLEHESTHYLTRRLLARMKNNLLDELIADYCGIVAAAGEYRSDWFLSFMGLEQYPAYRTGGRLDNYRGKPPLSDGAFRVLQCLAKVAAENVERFHREHIPKPAPAEQTARLALALTRLTMEELAAPGARERLAGVWEEMRGDVVFE